MASCRAVDRLSGWPRPLAHRFSQSRSRVLRRLESDTRSNLWARWFRCLRRVIRTITRPSSHCHSKGSRPVQSARSCSASFCSSQHGQHGRTKLRRSAHPARGRPLEYHIGGPQNAHADRLMVAGGVIPEASDACQEQLRQKESHELPARRRLGVQEQRRWRCEARQDRGAGIEPTSSTWNGRRLTVGLPPVARARYYLLARTWPSRCSSAAWASGSARRWAPIHVRWRTVQLFPSR
jgi:hypothetical protein